MMIVVFSNLFGYWMRTKTEVGNEMEIFITLTKYNTRQRREEGTIYQPLRSGRIWHKVNFLSGV